MLSSTTAISLEVFGGNLDARALDDLEVETYLIPWPFALSIPHVQMLRGHPLHLKIIVAYWWENPSICIGACDPLTHFKYTVVAS